MNKQNKRKPIIPAWNTGINYQFNETVIPRIMRWNSRVAVSYKSSVMLLHDVRKVGFNWNYVKQTE